jgi:hypothetical protein
MDSTLTSSLWPALCRSAHTHANEMARHCGAHFADLIHGELRKLCGQQPPADAKEMASRQSQSIALISKIASISHASFMAEKNPNAADPIYQLTKRYCDSVPLTGDVAAKTIAFTSQVFQARHV